MRTIPIYKSEIELGLADKITASASIVYASQIEEAKDDVVIHNLELIKKFNKTLASINDKDLYPTKSLLVSTNWNKNDDVFDKAEVWPARHTPSHKPTNLDHDEKILVGHMTHNWSVDDNGNILDEASSIDDLPNSFHIINAAVIYTNWESKDLIDRTEKLIAEIKAGQRFVSMECCFTNFDYAVIHENSKGYVIPRNEQTSYLTSRLRAYGGDGLFEGRRIGRLLRNITFSGKGYVKNPANPNSIIFNTKSSTENIEFDKTSISQYSGVYNPYKNPLNVTEKTMSDNVLQEQLNESKQLVASLQTKVDSLTKELASVHSKEFEAKIQTLEAQVKSAMDEKEEEKKEKEKVSSDYQALQNELETLKAEKNTLQASLDKANEEKLLATRISTLVDGNVPKDIAVAKVEKYKTLSDELFKDMADDIIKAHKNTDATVVTEEDDTVADDTVLETVVAEEETVINPSAEGEDALASVRVELQNYFKNNLRTVSKE